MTTPTLDWTDAFIKNMDQGPFAARAEDMARRMASQVRAGRLPAMNMPFWPELKGQLAGLKDKLGKFEHMLVLGIGGSALGARALQKAFAPGQDMPGHQGPWLWISDNVDPVEVPRYFEKLPAEKTVVVVISKSGGTIETISQYFLAKDWLTKALPETWHEHLLLVTDQNNGFLRDQASELGAMNLPVPDNLGGRYSVLSAVGLVPALFLGMDYEALVQGALDMTAPLTSPDLDAEAMAAHPSFKFAAWNMALMEAGYDQLIFFSYAPSWACFGDWFAQLWAESLGKAGKGSQPIQAVGVTDQHSVNQMFLDGPRNKGCLFLTAGGHPDGPVLPTDIPDSFDYVAGKPFGDLLRAEGLGTRMALVKNGVPLVNMDVVDDNEYMAGKMMSLFMAATLITGWMMDINPIDQPAVELGKRLAKARLGAAGLEEEKADLDSFLNTKRDVTGF